MYIYAYHVSIKQVTLKKKKAKQKPPLSNCLPDFFSENNQPTLP